MPAPNGNGRAHVLRGDALALPLADQTVDLIVTSPPYFALRSYRDAGEHYSGQLGSEPTPAAFVDALIAATREMMRVLKPTGSIFLNLGDKYAGTGTPGYPQAGPAGEGREHSKQRLVHGPAKKTDIPNKSLMGIPWRYAIRCIDDLGLILRAEVIWSKPNGLPESVTDRVRRSHEYWFHFVRQPRYYSAIDEIREAVATADPFNPSYRANGKSSARQKGAAPGQTRQSTLDDRDGSNPLGKLPGSVWSIPTQPLTVPAHLGVDHFAAFPMEWPRRLIRGWSPPGVCIACGFLLGSSYDNGMLGVRRSDNGRTHQNRARTQARSEAEPVLQQDLFQPLECPPSEDDQVPPTHDPRLCGDLEAGSPDGTEERLHNGAPIHHGGTPRPDAGTERGRASQERGQDGQPSRESRAVGQDRARQAPEARTQTVRVPTLRRPHPDVRNALSCPHCGSDRVRPSLILDPFGGTGTTSLVARALGRRGITLDMSADYCRIATWRTSDPGEYARALQVDKPAVQVDGQGSLLDLLIEEPQ